MIELYNIEGTKNICSYDIEHPCYNSPSTWPTFQDDYEKFKNLILDAYNKKESKLFLRIFDGEFYFLQGQSVGNIPNRHSRNVSALNLQKFKDGVYKSDYVLTQLYTEFTDKYKVLFPDRKFDYPMEFIYALVANKWLFKTFKNKIGLIGSSEKLKIIKQLMQHQQYRDYLGTDEFIDYIEVPERFACDNIDELEVTIGEKLKNSKSDIFLFGIGISKLALAHRFKKYKQAVFIDVGCGISALAGTTALERPYFGGWTNFRLKNFNYFNIDQMDYNDTRGLNEIYL